MPVLESLTDADVLERLDGLDVPFQPHGLDRFGLSKEHLGAFYTLVGRFYRSYFQVRSHGVQNVPDTGPVMLIGNHSGGLPVDAGMVVASLFFDHDPPRHAHGMVEKFANKMPFLSTLFSRLGQLTGLPEHAVQLLQSDRVLMVFPEGARGTGKLYRDRYKLVRFGTGFMRIALQTGAPIVPFAFVGGEEALPTVYHAKGLAKLLGVPYFPVPPYLIPIPRPTPCELLFGPALRFEGDGSETDDVIEGYVEQVRQVIVDLIAEGRPLREARL